MTAADETGDGGGVGKPRPEKESDLRRQTTSALKRGVRNIDERKNCTKIKSKIRENITIIGRQHLSAGKPE